MRQVPLNSRLISSVAYNPDNQTLHVWLRNRRHVIHHNISEAVYDNLMNAESAGFYYSCYIGHKATPERRHRLRAVVRLAAACAISMLIISMSATSIAGVS